MTPNYRVGEKVLYSTGPQPSKLDPLSVICEVVGFRQDADVAPEKTVIVKAFGKMFAVNPDNLSRGDAQ